MQPIAKLADKLHFTPNVCTFLGLAMAALSGVFIVIASFSNASFHRWFFLLFSCLFLLASGFFDMLDGVLARYQKSSTVFGGFFDSVLDRYSDAIVIIGIIISGFCNLYFGLIALIGSIFVSYSRARAESSGVPSKFMAAGIAERMERLVILIIAVFIEQGVFFLNVIGMAPVPPTPIGIWGILFPSPIGAAILILAIITHATVIHRIYIAYNRLPRVKMDTETYEKEKERLLKQSQEKSNQKA